MSVPGSSWGCSCGRGVKSAPSSTARQHPQERPSSDSAPPPQTSADWPVDTTGASLRPGSSRGSVSSGRLGPGARRHSPVVGSSTRTRLSGSAVSTAITRPSTATSLYRSFPWNAVGASGSTRHAPVSGSTAAASLWSPEMPAAAKSCPLPRRSRDPSRRRAAGLELRAAARGASATSPSPGRARAHTSAAVLGLRCQGHVR